MQFFVGIDGGGTHTRALVVDVEGRHGGAGESGLSNPNHASRAEVRGHIASAMQAACASAGATLAECRSVFLGIAGVTTESGRQYFREIAAECGLGHANIGVDHDIRIALAGGLAGAPGIALIAGTGSSCYGRTAAGETWQTGGWEALISDEGSGYFLGREAITLAARMADGRTAESPLRAQVFEWLGITAIADILPRIQRRGLSRSEIAAFAPAVIRLADEGDAAAGEILDRGAILLAEMVAANHRRLPTGPKPDVVIVGGVATAPGRYRDRIRAAILARLPAAEIHDALLPPAAGAALLAIEQTGTRISRDLIDNLKQFVP